MEQPIRLIPSTREDIPVSTAKDNESRDHDQTSDGERYERKDVLVEHRTSFVDREAR